MMVRGIKGKGLITGYRQAGWLACLDLDGELPTTQQVGLEKYHINMLALFPGQEFFSNTHAFLLKENEDCVIPVFFLDFLNPT